jgi:hypothetical protein
MHAEMELHVVIGLLLRGRSLDNLSSALTVLALGFALAAPLLISPFSVLATALLLAVAVLGLMQKYWALRVALDADLFALLAKEPSRLTPSTQALDQALVSLGLLPTPPRARSTSERSRGALRLLRAQALLLTSQVLLTTGAALNLTWLALNASGAPHA